MLKKSICAFQTICSRTYSCIHCTNKTNIMKDIPENIKLSERLSTLIRPTNYKLLLQPNVNNGLFKGSVIISVKSHTNEAKNYFNLHTKFLNITNVKVYDKHEKEIQITKYLEVTSVEQLLILFDKPLEPGQYKIEIDFDGDLTRNFVGFYLSRLDNNRKMVASKFQPTYARQAFPCFDEPDFKATYDITLVKPREYVALSNMNEISSKPEDDHNDAVTFATSVPMSTYLACFVICDFGFKQSEIDAKGIGKNFTLRCFAQKNQMRKIDFAHDIAKRATEYYVQYYEVPFPLPKLDMIAIPDYVSGATEHWGLVTYRETSFLVDPVTSSWKNKLSAANTIAHELAHMWFGNLVTVKWWDELWLNEGFASYMQIKALHAIEPSWSMLDQFLTKTLHGVLVTDAKLSSHPIVQVVETPDQITAIFDAISYSKGASVLRMLEGFIGEENFRRAISDYLKKFEFGNAVTKDLLACLNPYFKADNPGMDLEYIMDTWTRQMGYPVLTVETGSDVHEYVVTQRRFLLDPDAKYTDDSPFHYRWFVPVTYKTNTGAKQNVLWFPDSLQNVKIKLSSDEQWLKINNNQVGYYRVNYSPDMWRTLIEQLKSRSQQLSISDRAHLLNDIFALADATLVPYDLALELTSYLTVEEDYVPWTTAGTVFSVLSSRLLNTTAEKELDKYVQQIIQAVYKKQSWSAQDLTLTQSLLRNKILSTASKFGLKEAEAKANEIFMSWLNNGQEIQSDLRDFVYYNGMKKAKQADWDKLWHVYLNETDAQEKNKLRSALAAPRDGAILKKYLTLAADENNVRSQDYLNVLSHISGNPSGSALVWDLVRESWPQLVDRFTLNSRYLGNTIPAITSAFNTEERLKEMEDFFAKYPEAGAGETARARALETVRNNVKWNQRHLSTVIQWLDARDL